MRRLVAVFSDTHAGSNKGLLNPDVTLFDEDEHGDPQPWTPTPTAIQKWLWANYQADMARVMEIAGDDEVVVLHNGDLTWGSKYMTEMVSTRKSDQIAIAVANLVPWLALPNVQHMRLCHGTGSHQFGEATSDALVSAQLQAMYPASDVQAVRHGLASVDGVGIDYAHHGPSAGIRQWTNGNQLRYYAKSLMNDEILRGRTPPRIVVRSHFHTYTRETVRVHGEREWVTDIFVTPAYCGLTEYATQATRSAYLIGCGLILFEVVDGALREVYPLVRVVDLRREETL